MTDDSANGKAAKTSTPNEPEPSQAVATGRNTEGENRPSIPDDELAHAHSLAESIVPVIDNVFAYLLWRGLVAILWIHFFYKTFGQILIWRRSSSTATSLDVRFLPFRGLRWLRFRVRVEPGDEEDKISISLPYRILSKSSLTLRGERPIIALYLLILTVLASFAHILFAFLMWPIYFIWAFFRALTTTLRIALYSIPILLAILVIVFTTGDAWRLYGSEAGVRFAALILIIIGAGIGAIVRIVFRHANGWRAIWQSGKCSYLAKETPASVFADADLKLPPDIRKQSAWSRRLAANTYALVWFIVIAQLIAVVFWISSTFILLGLICVNRTDTQNMLNSPPTILWQFHLLGQTFILTQQLVLLSVTLGVVAALTFATLGLQDEAAQQEFVAHSLADLRKTLAVLAYYIAGLDVLANGLKARELLPELASVRLWMRPFIFFTIIQKATGISGESDQRMPTDAHADQLPHTSAESEPSG